MSERLKELAWKASVPARVPWVRIPLLPPKKGNNMFDSIYKRLQKLESKIVDLCAEDINTNLQDGLYGVISMIEDLKGYINEIEDTILEEDSHIDRTNI